MNGIRILHVLHLGWFWALFLLLLLAACETVNVPASTHQSFLATWNAQLEKYRADFIAKDVVIRAEDAKGFSPELRNVADPWRVLVSRTFELSMMIREEFTIAGRGEMIKAFIIHMQTNPTPGLSDVWFLRQAEDVQKEARDVDAKTHAFLQSFDEKVRKGPDWIREAEDLARAQGLVAGKIEELQSLHKQALNYYQDINRAQAEARYRTEQQAQAAQALMAMGVYLGQLNYQQQLLNTLNRPRNCTFFVNMMTCQ